MLVVLLLLLRVMTATVAAVGCEAPELEIDRLPVLLVRRRTILAPVDVANAVSCLVGRKMHVCMAALAWTACRVMMVMVRWMIFFEWRGSGRAKARTTTTSRAGWASKNACQYSCVRRVDSCHVDEMRAYAFGNRRTQVAARLAACRVLRETRHLSFMSTLFTCALMYTYSTTASRASFSTFFSS